MSLYEAIKDGVNIAQKADNIELYKMLLDVQKEALDLIEENRDLKEKIRDCKEKEKLDKSIVYKADAYYKDTGSEVMDGPFCRVCWDKDKKLIRMSVGNYSHGQAVCQVCDFVARTIL